MTWLMKILFLQFIFNVYTFCDLTHICWELPMLCVMQDTHDSKCHITIPMSELRLSTLLCVHMRCGGVEGVRMSDYKLI